MVYKIKPEGVCSREIIIDIDASTIKEVKIIGGCPGNSLGLASLIIGMSVEEAIKRLKGIPCGVRGTSCPDQLAQGLEKIKEEIA